MSVSEENFKELMSNFASGVTVVTVEHEETLTGLTVSSFASVSLDPPLVLVCIENDARTNKLLKNDIGFTVNILSEKQTELSKRFARPGLSMEERLEGISYGRVDTGGPVLTDCLAWLECEPYDKTVAGDHTIYVGKVIDGDVLEEGSPLLYHQGEYGQYRSR